MGLILDTSALVVWERTMPDDIPFAIDPDAEIILPAIVWAEALSGVRLADTAQRAAQRLSRLEAIRRIADVEPFTAETAQHYADIFAELSSGGLLIPQNDIVVAATARQHDCCVLVGPKDEANFRRVEGIQVVLLAK